jgi:hypothetical protein
MINELKERKQQSTASLYPRREQTLKTFGEGKQEIEDGGEEPKFLFPMIIG